jgi:glycosyltransferase involved in cell wall biosynthesis
MALYFLINSLAGGGAEKVIVRLAKHLKPSKIFLLERDVKQKTETELIYLSDHRVKTNPIFKSLYIPIYAKKLEKFLTVEDTVISFMERSNFVNLLSKTKHKKIIAVRTYRFARKNFHPYRWMIKKLYPKADLIITNSRALEFSVKNFLKVEKVKTIYNPIEIEEIKRKSTEELGEYEFLKNFPYLITVGRLTKAKGQWYLLRIFKHLKGKYRDLKLLILGEGELKDYLVELSQNLGLKTYVWDRDKLNESYDVYFLGFQENPYKFIKHSKTFVFTSLWEGLPNVLIESLAVGKTVISTDCRTGPREILAPRTDFLLETNKPQPEEFGILMPTFERKLLKANDPLTAQEKIWIDTLLGVLNNEKLLKEYELKAPSRAWDFHIDKISQQWFDVIKI